MQSILFWLSVLEGGMFLLSLLLFFTDPVEMVYIWYHIVHVFRCGVGLLIYNKAPRSHQMAANISIPSHDKMQVD